MSKEHRNRSWRSRQAPEPVSRTAVHASRGAVRVPPGSADPEKDRITILQLPASNALKVGAKRPVGRPVTVGGTRVHVFLTDADLATAAKLGAGNVSAGIRKALGQAVER